MRLPIVAATALLAMALSGQAKAAGDCTGSETLAPDLMSGSIIFDNFLVASGDSLSCTKTLPVAAIPAGTVGVYKVDSRGFLDLANGDAAVYSVLVNGQTQQTTFNGPSTDDTTLTYYFGSGPSASFTGTFTYDLTGAPIGDVGLDSVDVLVDYTTVASVQSSIDSLATEGTVIVSRFNTTGDLLTGGNQPLEAPNNIALFGAVGSSTFGLTAHYDLGNGFSVDGGGAYTHQDTDATSFAGPVVAAALRYLQPGADALRPFGAVGLEAAPGIGMSFSRHYDDASPDGRTIVSSTNGNAIGVFAEGGVLIAPTPDSDITFSGTLMRNWLGVDGFAETIGDTNLFPATVPSGTLVSDTVKAKAAWTARLSPQFDLTLSAAIGKTVAESGLAADVAFVGPITGDSQDEAFTEYGARLGWKINPTATADSFILGSTGSSSGTHLQFGEALRVAF